MAALQQPRPYSAAIETADRWKDAARTDPDFAEQISGNLGVFVLAQWGDWAPDERVDKVLHIEAIDALSSYPLWAIERGLRTLHRTAIYRPKLAEIIAAVQSAYGDLVTPLAAARQRIEQMEEIDRRAAAAGAKPSPAKLKALEDLQNLVAQVERDGEVGGEDGTQRCGGGRGRAPDMPSSPWREAWGPHDAFSPSLAVKKTAWAVTDEPRASQRRRPKATDLTSPSRQLPSRHLDMGATRCIGYDQKRKIL